LLCCQCVPLIWVIPVIACFHSMDMINIRSETTFLDYGESFSLALKSDS
jgi:hypothetical protein